jgi:hypothetical protein
VSEQFNGNIEGYNFEEQLPQVFKLLAELASPRVCPRR